MKTVVVVGKKVLDSKGLKKALQAAIFDVIGMTGSNKVDVSVYLQDSEIKDPTAFVMSWNETPQLRVVSNKPLGSGGAGETIRPSEATEDLTGI